MCYYTDEDLGARLKRRSDRITSLILYSDTAWVDIAIEIENMREMCLSEAPEKAELFEHLYESRFYRLRNDWRQRDENF